MIRLIGFAGRAGSGKSFAAKTLVQHAGFVRTRFADPLKDMLRVLGLGYDEIEGHLKEAPSPLLCGKTPRFAMQRLGTEFGRELIGPSLWIDAWARRADAALAAGGAVVVDDVRFPNEVAMIRECGGIVAWIDREGGAATSADHVSEKLRPEDCNIIVRNSGGIEFEQTIASVLLEEICA